MSCRVFWSFSLEIGQLRFIIECTESTNCIGLLIHQKGGEVANRPPIIIDAYLNDHFGDSLAVAKGVQGRLGQGLRYSFR